MWTGAVWEVSTDLWNLQSWGRRVIASTPLYVIFLFIGTDATVRGRSLLINRIGYPLSREILARRGAGARIQRSPDSCLLGSGCVRYRNFPL